MTLRQIIFIVIGTFLAVIGVIVSVSPMPLGFLLLLPGLTMLIYGSPRFAAWVRMRRARNAEINERAVKLADKVNGPVGKALKKTDPHLDPVAGPKLPGWRRASRTFFRSE